MLTQDWLLAQWKNLFGEAISSMAGQAVSLSIIQNSASDSPVIWWSQKLSLAPQELIWIGAPLEKWKSVGTLALIGAGIDEPSDDDIDGTFHELVQQALSRIAQAIGQVLRKDVTCGESTFNATAPDCQSISFAIECDGKTISPLYVAFDASLFEPVTAKAKAAAVGSDSSTTDTSKQQQTENLKSIDLLLDVELPVGVSFGKAILQLKDVIKLTTGSIVELNRSVSEPVEVIVNNCVIARGEVVVIDGNYGVRIHHIVSRQERLRSIH